MEFTDHELMFIFDAVAFYAARPIFDDLPECEEFFLAIGQKCGEELERRGYVLKGTKEYTVRKR